MCEKSNDYCNAATGPSISFSIVYTHSSIPILIFVSRGTGRPLTSKAQSGKNSPRRNSSPGHLVQRRSCYLLTVTDLASRAPQPFGQRKTNRLRMSNWVRLDSRVEQFSFFCYWRDSNSEIICRNDVEWLVCTDANIDISN